MNCIECKPKFLKLNIGTYPIALLLKLYSMLSLFFYYYYLTTPLALRFQNTRKYLVNHSRDHRGTHRKGLTWNTTSRGQQDRLTTQASIVPFKFGRCFHVSTDGIIMKIPSPARLPGTKNDRKRVSATLIYHLLIKH